MTKLTLEAHEEMKEEEVDDDGHRQLLASFKKVS